MDEAGFRIETQGFEGPLDLLLHLIEKRKLLINDISLASVTDDFITYVKELGEIPLSQTAQFVYTASTLLLIKSKSLLPVLSLTQEEEDSIEDLEIRLKLYKYFLKLSVGIKNIYGVNVLFPRQFTRSKDPVFSPPGDMNIGGMQLSMQNVIANLPKKALVQETTVKKTINLEEVIESLTKRIQSSISLSFKDFSGTGKAEKVNVIVSFLAMLELVKQEVISVKQEQHFDDIHMENQQVGLPQYGNS